MRFKAAIFDLDGTLLDTLEDIANAANEVLQRSGVPTHPVEDYRLFVGDGVRALVERALPEAKRDDALIDLLDTEFRDTYGRNWNVRTRPYEGVPEMLDSVCERGLALAVLSNKPDDFTKRCVSELLPRWSFAAVVGERAGVPKKPHPAGAVEIARSLGVQVTEIVYLGDSGVDMKTATAAGMYAVGASWGFRSRSELERAGATTIIDHPRDLLALP